MGQKLEIAGLETTTSWFHSRGSERYLRTLQAFVKNQSDTPREIRDALSRNDQQTAERFAHTLKGLAALIGAREVQLRAAALEDNLILRQGVSSARDSLVAALDCALAQQMQAIVDAVGPTPVMDKAPTGVDI